MHTVCEPRLFARCTAANSVVWVNYCQFLPPLKPTGLGGSLGVLIATYTLCLPCSKYGRFSFVGQNFILKNICSYSRKECKQFWLAKKTFSKSAGKSRNHFKCTACSQHYNPQHTLQTWQRGKRRRQSSWHSRRKGWSHTHREHSTREETTPRNTPRLHSPGDKDSTNRQRNS